MKFGLFAAEDIAKLREDIKREMPDDEFILLKTETTFDMLDTMEAMVKQIEELGGHWQPPPAVEREA